MSPTVPPRGCAPLRSMCSSAIMPLSMRATRVSAMSQEITRIFLAILGRAFPPEGADRLQTSHTRKRRRSGGTGGRRESDRHPPLVCASRNESTVLPRAPPRGLPRFFARAALATGVNRPASKEAGGGRENLWGPRRTRPKPTHLPYAFTYRKVHRLPSAKSTSHKEKPHHTLPRYRCSLPGLAGFTYPRRQGRTRPFAQL